MAAQSTPTNERSERQRWPEREETEPELRDGLDHLLELLQRSRVPDAREWVKELASRWPDSPVVQHYGIALEPPVSSNGSGAPARPLDDDYAWLKAHGDEYPGCWIATHGFRLVSAHPELSRVLEELRRQPVFSDAFLHRQPGEPD